MKSHIIQIEGKNFEVQKEVHAHVVKLNRDNAKLLKILQDAGNLSTPEQIEEKLKERKKKAKKG